MGLKTGILFLLLSTIMSQICAISQAAELTPAGQIYPVPLKLYTQDNNKEGYDLTGQLLLPAKQDDQGTVSLIIDTTKIPYGMSAQLLSINRSDLPPPMQFITGDNTVIHLRFGNEVIGAMASPRAIKILQIPFDKHTPLQLPRTLKLTDCQGSPVSPDRVNVLTTNYRFGFFNRNLPIKSDGLIQLPAVLDIRNYPQGYHSTESYHLSIMDKTTSLTYAISLRQDGESSVTQIMLPMIEDTPLSTTAVASGRILNSDGSPLANSNFTVPIPRRDYQQYQPGVIPVDEPLLKASHITTDANGEFELAISPQFLELSTGASIPLYLSESGTNVYGATSFDLAPGEKRDLQLPKRATVPITFIDESGSPIQFQPDNGHYSFRISKVGNDGSYIDDYPLTFQARETSGVEFQLTGIPVPGKYVIHQEEQYYGPVEINSETTTSGKISFPIELNDGQVKGRVLTENGDPLQNALVLYVTDGNNVDPVKNVGEILEAIKDKDTSAALETINTYVKNVLAFNITGEDGKFGFPRTLKPKESPSPPVICALGANRIGARHYDMEMIHTPLSNDIPLPDVHLPITTIASGRVSAPLQMPDEENPGKLIPMPAGEKYSVNVRESRAWFAQDMNEVHWQYLTSGEQFEFGSTFEYDVPVGTTFTLCASPSNKSVHLSLETWSTNPLSPSETWQTTASTLRALQPYKLSLKYADGTPAAGLEINTLYANRRKVGDEYRMPLTDENGQVMIYGDEGLAPSMHVMRRGSSKTRMKQDYFKIQKLDMSTSIPTLTLTLDPKKWGENGEDNEIR